MDNLADKLNRHNVYEIPIGRELMLYAAVMGGGLTVFLLSAFLSVQFATFGFAVLLTVAACVLGIVFSILPKAAFRIAGVFINLMFTGFAVSLIYIKLEISFPVLNAVFVTAGMFALFALVIVLLRFNIGVRFLPTAFIIFAFILLLASTILIFKTNNPVFIFMAFCSLIIFANSIALKTYIYGQDGFLLHLVVANCLSAGIAVVAVIITLAALSDGSCDCDCGAGDCCGDCCHLPARKTKITGNKYKIK